MNLARYNKLIVALAGAVVVILTRHFGPTSAYVLDIETLLTAAGVYAVPNEKGSEKGQASARVLLAIVAGALGLAALLAIGDVDAVKLLAVAVIVLAVAVLVP